MKLKVIFYQAIEQNISLLKGIIQSWTLGLYSKTHTTPSVKKVKQHTLNGATLMDLCGVTEKYQTHG